MYSTVTGILLLKIGFEYKQVNIIEGRLNLSKLPKFYTHLLIFHLLIYGNIILYDVNDQHSNLR